MRAQRLPASRGWSWIVEGFLLFRRNPTLLTFLVFGYWFLLVIMNLLPMVGWVLSSLCMPALAVSVLNGCRAIERDEPMQVGLLFSGFQSNLQALIVIGGLYFAASITALLLASLFVGGDAMQGMLGGEPANPESLDEPRVFLELQMALLMMLPVLMAFWFAPPLAAWANCGAVKALFFSIVASFRNWRAFLVYGFGIAMIAAVLPGFVLGTSAVISKTLLNIMVVALAIPLVVVFVPTLFASFYVSYRDVFSPEPASSGANGNADAPAS